MTRIVGPVITISFALIVIATLVLMNVTERLTAQSGTTVLATISERDRVLMEAFAALKRAGVEIAHNPDALELIALGTGKPARAEPYAESFRSYADRISAEGEYYEGYFFMDRDDSPVFTYGVDRSAAILAGRTLALKAKYGNQSVEGPLSLAPGTEPVIVVGTPVYDRNDRNIGTAGLVVSLRKLTAPLLSSTRVSGFALGILDESLRFLLPFDGSAPLESSLPPSGTGIGRVKGGVLGRTEGYGIVALGESRYLLGWSPFRLNGWTLVGGIPARDFELPFDMARMLVAAIVLVAILATVLVALRTRQLGERNAELARTLSELAEAQDRLVQSAKNAALGRAVTTIAHQINTPIGVAITSSSYLASIFEEAESRRSYGGAEEARLADRMREAIGILEQALRKAASLVDLFKRATLDLSDEALRVMDVRGYLEENSGAVDSAVEDEGVAIRFHRMETAYARVRPGAIGRLLPAMASLIVDHRKARTEFDSLDVSVYPDGESVVVEFVISAELAHGEEGADPFEPYFRSGTSLKPNELAVLSSAIAKALDANVVFRKLGGRDFTIIVRFPSRLETTT